MYSSRQSDLQDSQKKTDEMEEELQRANHKVCNTEHLLRQLSIKVNLESDVAPNWRKLFGLIKAIGV